MRAAAIIVALWCVGVVPSLAGPPPMTTLRVEVKSLSDKPVDRAAVVVRFVEGHSVKKLGKKIVTQWELRTNQEGVARVPSMPQGKILIQVIASGYQTFGQVFEVNEPEKTIAVKLNPPQPQYSVDQ